MHMRCSHLHLPAPSAQRHSQDGVGPGPRPLLQESACSLTPACVPLLPSGRGPRGTSGPSRSPEPRPAAGLPPSPFPAVSGAQHLQCLRLHQERSSRGFPGGAVVENLPANAGDTGSSPGLGRSHMPRSN